MAAFCLRSAGHTQTPPKWSPNGAIRTIPPGVPIATPLGDYPEDHLAESGGYRGLALAALHAILWDAQRDALPGRGAGPYGSFIHRTPD